MFFDGFAEAIDELEESVILVNSGSENEVVASPPGLSPGALQERGSTSEGSSKPYPSCLPEQMLQSAVYDASLVKQRHRGRAQTQIARHTV